MGSIEDSDTGEDSESVISINFFCRYTQKTVTFIDELRWYVG